jgi:hypothetical protein
VDSFNAMLQSLVSVFVVGAALMLGVPLLLRAARRSVSRRPGGGSKDEGLPTHYPYFQRSGLFTPAEGRFLRALDAAVGASHRVFGKVRLADIVDVDSALPRGAWRAAFNRISSKHVDFVVCEGATLRLVAAVELDDVSHDTPRRRSRDLFVERTLATAGVQLVRVPVTHEFDVIALRHRLLGPEPEASAAASTVMPSKASSGPRCPQCGSGMERRTAARGTGHQEYFICERAPICLGRLSARVGSPAP